MANIITGIRIVLSVALLFFPVLSPAFFLLYVAGGLSDMIDGAAARRTGTVSEFGSRLDTFADIVFAAVCLIKLLPILDVPVWLYVWFAVIAIIKFSSITAGYTYTLDGELLKKGRSMAFLMTLNQKTAGYIQTLILREAGER